MAQSALPTRNVNTGTNSKLGITTAGTIVKASGGTLATIIVVVAPTSSGALTIIDSATVVAATATNTILSIPYNSTTPPMTAGLILPVDWPCINGITVTAVGGGSPQYSISFA
jgi:hypothetical protein